MIPIALARLLTPEGVTNVLSSDISKRAEYISVTWNFIARTASNLLSQRVALSGFTVELFMCFNKISQRWVDAEKKT